MLTNDESKLLITHWSFLRGDEIIRKYLNTRTVIVKSAETGILDYKLNTLIYLQFTMFQF